MTIKMWMAGAALAASTLCLGAPAQAQDKVLGELFPVGYDWCPRGSARTDGQLLAIQQNQALFSLLGTNFGGDGRTTFGLPDLRSRSPMGVGAGNGLTPRIVGERVGTETTTLLVSNMPAHAHNPVMRVSRVNATTRNPINAYLSRSALNVFEETTEPTGDLMAADAISSNTVGGGQAISNMMPTAVITYCIALQGIFPSRN